MYERIKKINGQKYRYLVKGVRVGGKVKQIFIKYIGKVPEETADPLKFSEVPETEHSWEHFLALRGRERRK